MTCTRIQANTSLYNNRKVKPATTGEYTIRQLSNSKYIVIAHFTGWQKSHAIDFRTGKPFQMGQEYPTFESARKDCRKYGLNMLSRPHLKRPLATSDEYFNFIHPLEKSITWK